MFQQFFCVLTVSELSSSATYSCADRLRILWKRSTRRSTGSAARMSSSRRSPKYAIAANSSPGAVSLRPHHGDELVPVQHHEIERLLRAAPDPRSSRHHGAGADREAGRLRPYLAPLRLAAGCVDAFEERWRSVRIGRRAHGATTGPFWLRRAAASSAILR